MRRGWFFGLLLLTLLSGNALAMPTQFGDTGMLSQPTAETLNAGNICIGAWGNHSSSDDGSATILPVAITLGLGTFMEAFGSFPSLLFNGDEDDSARGYANIGFKVRFLGKRSAPFKLAVDGQFRRHVSDNLEQDGLTDILTRLIASYKPGRFGLHLNAGYQILDNPEGATGLEDSQYVAGGGIEFNPTPRLRMLAELEYFTKRGSDLDGLAEATLGVQYHLSPHLTFNLGAGVGLSDRSPDYRVLFGFTACQGIGTYSRALPKTIEPPAPVAAPAEPEKVIKIRTLTPSAGRSAPSTTPPSQLEVPVQKGTEILLQPSERLIMPESEVAAGLAIAPISAAAGSLSRNGKTYALGEEVLSDSGRVIGRKIKEDPDYRTHFTSIASVDDDIVYHFFHDGVDPLPVWIEGAIEHSLSTTTAKAFEEVVLRVSKVNNELPSFKLHIGQRSEVFSFGAPLMAEPEAAADLTDAEPENPGSPQPPGAPTEHLLASAQAGPARDAAREEGSGGQRIPTVLYRKFLIPEFTFESNQWQLSTAGKAALAEIAENLRHEGRWFILRVDGHTDNIGPDSYNDRLSLRRAVSAASHIVTHHGFDAARIFVKGHGAAQPVADNNTLEGRLLNRRIELLVLLPEGEVE